MPDWLLNNASSSTLDILIGQLIAAGVGLAICVPLVLLLIRRWG